MTEITDRDREVAEAIVAANIEKWGWGPLDEIEDLSEHKLAVDACAAGIAAMSAEIERLEEWKRDAADELVKMTTRAVNAEAQLDQLRREKAALEEVAGSALIALDCVPYPNTRTRETASALRATLSQQEQRT